MFKMEAGDDSRSWDEYISSPILSMCSQLQVQAKRLLTWEATLAVPSGGMLGPT